MVIVFIYLLLFVASVASSGEEKPKKSYFRDCFCFSFFFYLSRSNGEFRFVVFSQIKPMSLLSSKKIYEKNKIGVLFTIVQTNRDGTDETHTHTLAKKKISPYMYVYINGHCNFFTHLFTYAHRANTSTHMCCMLYNVHLNRLYIRIYIYILYCMYI